MTDDGQEARLTRLLDTLVSLNEADVSQATVTALVEDIVAVFQQYPEAEGWWRTWRAAHPRAKLA